VTLTLGGKGKRVMTNRKVPPSNKREKLRVTRGNLQKRAIERYECLRGEPPGEKDKIHTNSIEEKHGSKSRKLRVKSTTSSNNVL